MRWQIQDWMSINPVISCRSTTSAVIFVRNAVFLPYSSNFRPSGLGSIIKLSLIKGYLIVGSDSWCVCPRCFRSYLKSSLNKRWLEKTKIEGLLWMTTWLLPEMKGRTLFLLMRLSIDRTLNESIQRYLPNL